MQQHLYFIIKYVIVGLALGFIYMMLFGNFNFTDQAINNSPSAVFSYAPAIDKITPSVVSIHTHSSERVPNNKPGISPRQPYITKSFLGSGVVVSPNGHIITNQHVIEKATRVQVFLWDNTAYEASYVGQDELTDLAVIKIDAENLVPAEFHDSEKINTGDVVLAIGNPFGLNQSASLGIVSATGRRGVHEGRLENFIQTDAAINTGNSGGPLINPMGHVVGISTVSYNQFGAEGINFAIPSNLTQQVVYSIIKHGKVLRGSVGLYFFNNYQIMVNGLQAPAQGILVSKVETGSSADLAGLKTYDVITHLNDVPVNSILAYTQELLSHTVGDVIEVKGRNKQHSFILPLIVESPNSNL